MCGILGTIGHLPNKSELLDALKIINHRGPDDVHTISIKNNILLGAVRLSFQDEEGGRQPVECGDGRAIVTLNGEIYNYCDLAKLVVDRGWKLKSRCDTEMIGYLYLEYGIEAFAMLRGMFAIALYSKLEEKVILACDFLAQKPIYYARDMSNSIVFASEQRCLPFLSNGHIGPKELTEGLSDVLLYKSELHINDDHRFVKRVAPGEIVEINLERLETSNKRFFSYQNWHKSSTLILQEEEVVNSIESILIDSVKLRVDPAKEQVAFLSGGVDSSLIVMIMRKLFPSLKIHTFTLCYNDQSLDGKSLDKSLSRMVSNLAGTEHHEVVVDPSHLYYDLPQIISCFGTAFSSVPSMWYLTKEMSKYGKYTLSGDGADELFGSYFTHRSATKSRSDAKLALRNYKRYMVSFWPKGLLRSDYIKSQLSSPPEIINILSRDKSSDSIKNQLIAEAVSIFPSTVLTYIDRLSMAHSLEARSPFLDIRLWNYVMELPDRFRIRGRETKYVLKCLAKRYLPNSLVYRKKEGFVYPLSNYLLTHKANIMESIKAIPNFYLNDVLNLTAEDAALQLYHSLDAGSESAFKACQALHSLYCIYLNLKYYSLL